MGTFKTLVDLRSLLLIVDEGKVSSPFCRKGACIYFSLRAFS